MNQTMVGDDDSKGDDEKESDGGEVSSPASQDHHNHQHPFTEGEELEAEKREIEVEGGQIDSEAKPSVSQDNHSHQHSFTEGEVEEVEKREIELEGIVQMDRELKPAHESESKDIKIEYVEPERKTHEKGSWESSSSSSDDESQVEKNVLLVVTAPVVDSASQVVNQVMDCNSLEDSRSSFVETALVVDLDHVSSFDEVIHQNGSASVDKSVNCDVVQSVLKENGEKKLPLLDGNVRFSPVVLDLGSQEKENVVVSKSDENAVASSDATQQNRDKLLPSYDAPRSDNSNGVEHAKDSEVHENCSDSQPLVASAPQLVQTTSWKSCCGLFELFTDSSR
ncbi:unnamed protein product [Ilex paraguariensis]|uniref:Uncharacterized protein n=1 Tax=Ilex paraguariensis TaxID=185542 RepID=A0ABC8R2S4_9AQUA